VSVVGPAVSTWGDYSSLTEGANAVFLTATSFNQSGLLFAYIVYFENLSPVRLQIWRPTAAAASFQLVCQRRHVPDVEQLHRRAVVSHRMSLNV